MRNEMKTTFRPLLESIEPRLVATAGVASAAAQHIATAHVATAHVAKVQVAKAPEVHAEAKHASHPPKHQAAHQATPTAPVISTQKTAPKVTTPATPLPKDTTTGQAWVELINMTGQDLEYQIKLGPYANGQFLTYDIGAGATQVRMSSLYVNGQREKADFAIQFGNGPVTPLMTGISQQSAQGYYIFFDSNFQPYVAPFFHS